LTGAIRKTVEDLVFGRNPVLEALRAGRAIRRLLLDEGAKDEPRLEEIARLARSQGISLERVPRRVLDERSSNGVHQGVLAFAESRPALDIYDLADETAKRHEPALYVVLDGIEDPHNLGAILRTADATGVHGVVTRSRRAVGLTPAAIKAAAGAAEYIPVVEVVNIAQSLEALKKSGIWVVGVDSTATESYLGIDYKPPTAIVVGAEGQGLSSLVKKKCDFLASIPMRGRIPSLNASVAAAVVLYEALRQRTA
jgi:23S rRNA (guanosine2251-2'-O)-methyltransferase